MSNIAGKSYAMNVITPIKWWMVWVNKLVFWIGGLKFFSFLFSGLNTLSMIHYARWVIIKANQFPRPTPAQGEAVQPEEDLQYAYMLFFSNFNGSWDQYVDSFASAIPSGLNLFWFRNVQYPKSVPVQPFHDYITYNQIWTNHYYNAYPMAASNDVKAAADVRNALLDLVDAAEGATPEDFQAQYKATVLKLQNDLSPMAPTPVVSLAAEAVARRRHEEVAING